MENKEELKKEAEELNDAAADVSKEETQPDAPSADEVCQKKIEELEEKCKESVDKHQRTLAEFDNFRKRTAKEKASMYSDGVFDTIEKLLPVMDNLERALMAEEGKEETALLKGLKMTLKQLKEILAAMGVEEIPAVGEKFDPNLHAAVAHEENEEFGENEISLEMLKGYKLKEKVLRHSMVKVAN